MVLQKVGCDFVKSFRHVYVRTSEPRGNRSFQRLYMALPRLTPQEVKVQIDSFLCTRIILLWRFVTGYKRFTS